MSSTTSISKMDKPNYITTRRKWMKEMMRNGKETMEGKEELPSHNLKP